MEKSIGFLTQSLGIIILAILSFMFGFNTSYKHSYIHTFIDFLLKCYIWLIEWLWSGIKTASLFINHNNILFSQYDEQFTQISVGFVVVFALGLLLETLFSTLLKLFSHSDKRS
ncbi:MAG: hypothetical protein KDD58_02960 [Bdellovibrionales bacterium]|nr:hypothetical protein [Bdellovibrionales bacterium]